MTMGTASNTKATPPRLERRIADVIEPLITSMGFDLVRVKLTGGRRKTVQIMIERPGGTLDVEDCAEVSRAVSALLDVEDPVPGNYLLEVSSPGIDRPLVRREDFERYLGHLAKIKLAWPIEGRKKFSGTLVAVAPDHVEIVPSAQKTERRLCLPFDQIEEAQLVLTEALIQQSLKAQSA